MKCPYCGSVVEPTRDATGALWCPACRNTGRIATAPFAPAAAVVGLSPPPPGGAPAKAPGLATAALVLGIAALVVFPLSIVLGPIGIVLAVKAMRQSKQLPGNPGQGMAVTGLVLAAIGVVVGITVVLAAVVFVLVSNLGEAEQWAFIIDDSGPGGVLTVDGYPGFPDWDEFTLGGTATCRLPSGPVEYGDDIVCTSDGTVVLIDASTNEALYEAEV